MYITSVHKHVIIFADSWLKGFTYTHLSEDIIFFSASALLYLSPSTLLSFSSETVSLGQECKGVYSALFLEMNELLGQGVKLVFKLCPNPSGMKCLLLSDLGRGEWVIKWFGAEVDFCMCECFTFCLFLSLWCFRDIMSPLLACWRSCSSLCRAWTVLSSLMRSRWFSLPLNICTTTQREVESPYNV